MEKTWLKGYPPGAPTNIDMQALGSSGERLEPAVAPYADRTAEPRNTSAFVKVSTRQRVATLPAVNTRFIGRELRDRA
jgi:hypothetical protein